MQRCFGAVGTYMPYFGMLCTVTSNKQRKRAVHWICLFLFQLFYLFLCKKSGIFKDFSSTVLLKSAGLCRLGLLVVPADAPAVEVWKFRFPVIGFLIGVGLTLVGNVPNEDPNLPACAVVCASSKPVAMTVIVQESVMDASYIAPKMIFTSSPARFCT